jgi:L-lactate dehydrogenase complex protein LldF
MLGLLGRRQGSFYNLPLAGGWTATREMPAPEGRTFQELWREKTGKKAA